MLTLQLIQVFNVDALHVIFQENMFNNTELVKKLYKQLII